MNLQSQEWRNLRLFGQELNYGTSAIARMNLFLHGIIDGQIAHGDTLTKPAFHDAHGRLQTFDVVLANPPYSIKAWNRDAFAKDPYGRNMWGVPPQNAADYAFIEHIAKSLDPQRGRAAILLPHGVLTRFAESSVREAMVMSDIVEAVIGVAPGLFYNSAMEAVVLILRTSKPSDRRNKVLFVNAKAEYYKKGKQSFLNSGHQRKIFTTYKTFQPDGGWSAVATREEIAATGFNLAVPLYVNRTPSGPRAADDLYQQLAAWRAACVASESALDRMASALREGSQP